MSLQEILVRFREALSGGGEVPPLAMMAFATVAVLLIVVIVAYIIYLRTDRGALDALIEDRIARTAPASVWPVRITIALLVAGTLLGADQYLAQPSQCAECHQDGTQAEALAASPHAGISCMRCHRAAGPEGLARQAVTYVRWVAVYAATQESPDVRAGSVEVRACLRCHQDVGATLVSNGIRVRHSDFLAAGWACRDCHNSVAHPEAVQEPTEPSMDKCIYCHDGEVAPTDCDLCHPDEPGEFTVDPESLPKVRGLDTGQCYACHDEPSECLFCHGASMPHPADWMPDPATSTGGTHARAAFVNREVCWRCHHPEGEVFEPSYSGEMGCTCHEPEAPLGVMHGGRAWVDEHWRQATGRKTGLLAECFNCHNNNLCSNCHPASYEELYAPRPGKDDYRRDVPLPPDYLDF